MSATALFPLAKFFLLGVYEPLFSNAMPPVHLLSEEPGLARELRARETIEKLRAAFLRIRSRKRAEPTCEWVPMKIVRGFEVTSVSTEK